MSENALQHKLSALLKERERLQVEIMAVIRRELVAPEASNRAAAVDNWNTLQRLMGLKCSSQLTSSKLN